MQRRVPALALALATTVGLAACGDPENRALCPVFDQFLGEVEQIRDADVEEIDVIEARQTTSELIGRVRQLGEVAVDRYDQPIDDLEATLDGLAQVLAGIPDDADISTWQPLVADSVEESWEAAERVIALIEPSCTTPVRN